MDQYGGFNVWNHDKRIHYRWWFGHSAQQCDPVHCNSNCLLMHSFSLQRIPFEKPQCWFLGAKLIFLYEFNFNQFLHFYFNKWFGFESYWSNTSTTRWLSVFDPFEFFNLNFEVLLIILNLVLIGITTSMFLKHLNAILKNFASGMFSIFYLLIGH